MGGKVRTSEREAVALDGVGSILSADAPHAAHFIVTVYGDIVEPRGGTLWMGTLIEVCAAHGISESLVRTAVSRLVASGRLLGERNGRRSFYRLTAAARREFAAAARVLFAPVPAPSGWLLCFDPAWETRDPGWARLGDGVAIAPDRSDIARPDGLLMRARTLSGEDDLPGFAARCWSLEAIGEGYRAVLGRYAPLAETLGRGCRPDGATALALRLRLVDEYRAVALSDPRLPNEALPANWPGHACRSLFIRLYLALAATSETYVGLHFRDANGFLLAATEASMLRLDRLARDEESANI